VVLALVSYVPCLLTQPGKVAADTKQYLYLDPGRLISSTISMWDPDVGAGTVTHQNIGFLFPMGPYYWVVQQLGIPTWVGQRIWMGTLFFAAGTGVLVLGRLLGLSRGGAAVGGLAYMLTPYVVDYIARISAIVMPWAALGWMAALTILAVRRGGWRYPALFAVVVALVGGVNATSILLVGLAPLLWMVFAVWGSREVRPGQAGGAALRLGVLSALVCVWWAAGLWAEGAYGIPVLRYTETIPTVASTSLSSEVLRGLGYWYFYGQDKVQPWTAASLDYTQVPWLIVVSFAVPALALALALVTRWRNRAFAAGLVLLGVVVAVGAYPFDRPTPLGAALKAAGSDSTLGLAMRSTNRIVPLVVLGLALLIGAGVSALVAWRWWLGLGVMGLATALVVADLPPLWDGTLVAANLDRPEQLPGYVLDAAKYLDAQGDATRVLGIPGEDFAYYRWGVTEDPVWPGLLDRPYLQRTVPPQGGPGTVDLLQALDESIQDGTFVPSSLAPIARLLSAGDILFESDEQYERFGTARPQPLWLQLTSPAAGLGSPVPFGTPHPPSTITYPLVDETQLGVATGAPVPPPVAVLAVPGARPLVRSESPSDPLVVAGSGQGLVDLASLGLLDGNPTVLYSGTLDRDPQALARAMADGAVLVLTDTDQKQLDTWGTLDDDQGYVEQAGETPLTPDPAEQPIDLFPGGGSASQTVAVLAGVRSVQATSYGNVITNTPEDQAERAVDGNPATAWTEGAFGPATGQRLAITLDRRVTTDHLTLLQAQGPSQNRSITRATIRFDGGRPLEVTLGASSRRGTGQVVRFPTRSFGTVSITVDATSAGARTSYAGLSGVGLAEVGIPGVAPVSETLRLPTDLLGRAGAASASHELVVALDRLRAPTVPPRTDPEASLDRTFTLPTARTFSLGGTARISTLDSDFQVGQLLGGGPGPGRTAGTAGAGARGATGAAAATVVASNSSSRLPGDLQAGAAAAIDGNPATAWVPGLGKQAGNWVQFSFDRPVTFGSLDLRVVADGRHSIPTRITLSTAGGSRTVDLPAIRVGKGRPQGSTTEVPVSFPALSGSSVTVTVDAVRSVHTLDYLSGRMDTEPVGLAEVGIPGVVEPGLGGSIPTRCVAGLLSIDGVPIDVQIGGPTAAATDGDGLGISGCGNSANGVTLSAGTHVVTTSTRVPSGFDVDALVLASAAGGAALAMAPGGQLPAVPAHPSPQVRVLRQGRSSATVSVAGDGSPFWLVLGQSQSRGWTATSATGVDLGPSTLIDGYANGWYVPGADAGGTTVFHLRWTPQRVVDVALVTSGAGLAVITGLAVFDPPWLGGMAGRRRPGRRRRGEAGGRRRRRDRLAEWRLRAPRWTGLRRRPSVPVGVPLALAAPLRPTGSRRGIDGPVPSGRGPLRPVVSAPWRYGGAAPKLTVALAAAALGALVAALVVAPVAALLVGPLVLIGLYVPVARTVVAAGMVGLVVATAVFVADHQASGRYLPDINWPSFFGPANSLVWTALLLLGVDVVVSAVRRRRSPPR
jgi:hypothetical protein